MFSIGKTKCYQSWGGYPRAKDHLSKHVYWRTELPDLSVLQQPVLPFAYGRSYGDSCLNEGGILLDVSLLRRFIGFDENRGILRCEAGLTFAEILETIVPRGWFLPVTPGTKYVSVAGAIANDIHGKNHHRSGTFGCHVTCFELLRSNGETFICSPTQNEPLFRATIGGLGLTGLILWAEFRLKPISSPLIDMERIRFSSLDEFYGISADSDGDHEYTVAWLDCLARGKKIGRGLFTLGNHDRSSQCSLQKAKYRLQLYVPFGLPRAFMNKNTVRAFNSIYYSSQVRKNINRVVHYDRFFFPLDVLHEWNRLYGKCGFLQYQCVVPCNEAQTSIREILSRVARSGQGSFLTVLKNFGRMLSPGLLSFPRPGTTLALDFPYRGEKTLKLLEDFDEIVRECKGAVYPAKDARMTSESFQAYFPNWKEFADYIDPKFSSSFWKRVSM